MLKLLLLLLLLLLVLVLLLILFSSIFPQLVLPTVAAESACGKGNPSSPTYFEETPGRTPHR